jgi:hypothetical protein
LNLLKLEIVEFNFLKINAKIKFYDGAFTLPPQELKVIP